MSSCPVCSLDLRGRRWRARLFRPMVAYAQLSIEGSPTELATTDVETCSEACMRVLQEWVDIRNRRARGGLRS